MEMKVESEAGTQIMLVILYHYTKKGTADLHGLFTTQQSHKNTGMLIES